MSDKYFNEKVLKEIKSNYPILEKSDKIIYHFNIIDNVNYFIAKLKMKE